MPASTPSRASSRGARTARPVARRRVAGRTADSSRSLWPGLLLGLGTIVLFVGLGVLLGMLMGCTIEKVTLYETVHYPWPGPTP